MKKSTLRARFLSPALSAPPAIATAAVVVAMRFVLLDERQGEVYGDVMIVRSYVQEVLAGRWPSNFVLSAGPLYHYLIVPIVALAGTQYFGLKIASALVSLGVLLVTYALARRLVDGWFALLATFIAGVSSWLLIFSRLGNSQILVPLLSTAALWLALRAVQDGRRRDVILCALVSTLGLYAYPQSFVVPVVIAITLLLLYWSVPSARLSDLLWFAGAAYLCAVPFIGIALKDPGDFLTGYIGSKLGAGGDVLAELSGNALRALLAFHAAGDGVFRSNPARLPHLDALSGVLFLAGIVYWLRAPRRRWSALLLVPLVLLQLPSILVLGRPDEVPSASRTLAVAPIAYLLVASGLWWLLQALRARGRARLAVTLLAAALAVIFGLNAQRYFGTYLDGMPYHDVAIGRSLAAYADSLPPDTQVYVAGCCWEQGIPEPFYEQLAARPANIHRLRPLEMTCETLRTLRTPAVLVWSFHDDLPGADLQACAPALLPRTLYSSARGAPLFNAAPVDPERIAGVLPVPAAAGSAGALLVFDQGRMDGRALVVGHSPFDLGQVDNLFDGKRETLVRGAHSNPLVLELRFDAASEASLLSLDLGSLAHFQIAVDVYAPGGAVATFVQQYRGLPDDPHLDIPLPGGARPVAAVRVEITDLEALGPDDYHIHVRELQLR